MGKRGKVLESERSAGPVSRIERHRRTGERKAGFCKGSSRQSSCLTAPFLVGPSQPGDVEVSPAPQLWWDLGLCSPPLLLEPCLDLASPPSSLAPPVLVHVWQLPHWAQEGQGLLSRLPWCGPHTTPFVTVD